MFSKYNSIKKFCIKNNKLNTAAVADDNEKNNIIRRGFIKKYVNLINDIKSIQELRFVSGINLNIIMNLFSSINYLVNYVSSELESSMKKIFKQLTHIYKLKIKDTKNYLLNYNDINIAYIHSNLMHLPAYRISKEYIKIASKIKKYILIQKSFSNDLFLNDLLDGLTRKLNYERYKFHGDYPYYFEGFKLVDKQIFSIRIKRGLFKVNFFSRGLISIL